jgi:tetratricopeptide (TPR) repeat protein
VLPVAVAYAIGGWVFLQVGDVLIGLLELPGWTGRILVALVAIGLPIALILSWIYDWTPKGIVLTSDEATPTPVFAHSDPQPVDVSELRLVRPDLGELIGRHRECDRLRDSLELAMNGKGGIVLIGGEPGVGKSRLGEEALAIGRNMGVLPLTGHAYEDRGAPYITSIEILEEVLLVLPDSALRDALGSTAPEIARLLPELRRKFPGIPEPAELPPEQQQRFLFNSVLEFLTRLGKSCPVVMLLDDMHWADESSIQLLEHIAPQVQRLPLLLVLTYRNVDADMREPFRRALASLSRESYVTRFGLRRFSRDDVQSLLHLLSGREPPDRVVNSIFRETNGNAFYVQSVYQHLADEGLLFDANDDWLTDIDPASLDVPDSVRLVTGRRIAKLSEATQDTLRIAAVIGLRFRLPLLEAAGGYADDMIDCIEEAERAHLLKRSAGERELRYEFVHALARQTVLGELSDPRRQKLHLTVAEGIETAYANSPEPHAADLAFHLAEADTYADADKLAHWLKIAGENAMATVAVEESIDYFDNALTILGDVETEMRADILHRRGSAQLSLGRTTEVQQDMDAAMTIYQNLGLVDKAARTASDLAYLYIWIAQPPKAHELAERGLALASEQISAARCNLLSIRGLAHSYGRLRGDPAAGKALHEQAVAMARQLDDPRLLAEMLQNQGLDCWVRLDKRAREIAREAAGILRPANQHWKLGQCLWVQKAGLVFAGKYEDAARLDDELLALANRNGDYGALGCAWLVTSMIELSRGNLRATSDALRISAEAFNAGGFPWGEFNAGYDAVVLLLGGNDEQAREALDKVGASFIEGIVFTGTQHGYWLSGEAQLGDTDVMEQYLRLKHHLPEPNAEIAAGEVGFLKGAIEALVIAGENEEAARLYPLIDALIERDLGHCEFTFGIHDRFAGMAAAAAQDWDNAERHYRRAQKLADSQPHRVDKARVRFWYARMLLERNGTGDRNLAKKFLAEARELGNEMGLHGLIRQIDEL